MPQKARLPGRILVIDDEPSIRDLMTRVLGGAGHQVSVVETGEAALQKLAAERYDALIVDKNLPGMNGLDVLRLVRSHHPWLRALLITAFPTAESEVEARQLGVHGYVVKPFGIVGLVAMVDDAIEAGRLAVR